MFNPFQHLPFPSLRNCQNLALTSNWSETGLLRVSGTSLPQSWDTAGYLEGKNGYSNCNNFLQCQKWTSANTEEPELRHLVAEETSQLNRFAMTTSCWIRHVFLRHSTEHKRSQMAERRVMERSCRFKALHSQLKNCKKQNWESPLLVVLDGQFHREKVGDHLSIWSHCYSIDPIATWTGPQVSRDSF